MNKYLLSPVILLGIAVTISAGQFIPATPDYSDKTIWYISLNDSTGEGADVFYVPATWEYDWLTADSVVSHYADPNLKKHRDHMEIEMEGICDYMGEGNNFYSPHYRHITLNVWGTKNELYIDSMYFAISFEDVKNAFSHFVKMRDNSRPYFLAGFSQGGKSIVELMKVIPDSLKDKMIASYVIGYKVTPTDTCASKFIVPVEGEKDLGVTICYNSVVDTAFVKPLISEPNVAGINPVNWTKKRGIVNLNDTITVDYDTTYNVLVVNGFDQNKLKPVFDILNIGDLHSADPWIYRDHLRKNIKVRLNEYKTTHRFLDSIAAHKPHLAKPSCQ